MRIKILICLIFISNVFPAQILKKYKAPYDNFYQLLKENPEKAKEIIIKIQNSNDFKNNDSLKATNYLKWGKYYQSENKPDSALVFFQKGVDIGIKSKFYDGVSDCYYQWADLLETQNKTDNAITYYKKAAQYAKLAKNIEKENNAYIDIARKLKVKGNFIESNKILFERLKYLTEKEVQNTGRAYGLIANNYNVLGIPKLAEKYYHKANNYLKKSGNRRMVSNNIINLVDFYNAEMQYTKALKYVDSITYYSDSDDAKVFYHIQKAKTYRGMEKWDLAIQQIDKALDLDKKLEDTYDYAIDLIMKGQIYMEKGDYERSYEVFTESKKLFESEKIEDMVMKRQLYRDYIRSYLHWKIPDLGKDYETFITVNDSLTFQTSDKNIAELEIKYNASEKEAKIANQQLELQKEKTNRNFAISGVAFLLLLSGGGFLFLRNRQKQKELQNQNTLLGLQHNLNEMELQNLNKQLDPHEIKNLLASISPEIQEKAPESYRKMLKLFNITKASLNNNSITDTIENQVQQINDFLSLEKNMLSEPLEYSVENKIENPQIQIPRLMLKNLVENSVKHGIKGKENGGAIHIILEEKENFISIIVDDTGKGRKHAISLDSGIGTTTYQKLFATLNQKNKESATFEIFDKEQGTKVEVRIPRDYQY